MCFVGREPGKDISKTKAALTMLIILGIWAVRFPKMHASLTVSVEINGRIASAMPNSLEICCG